MQIEFHKYHGAGNDFVLIDDRSNSLHERFGRQEIAGLCQRRFGIGADGLMFLRSRAGYDFEMVYYNADGAPSSMCGNGARCIVRFAADLGLARDRYRFLAVDGPHEASLLDGDWVSVLMRDVASVEATGDAYVLDTGSPHYITFGQDPATVDVVRQGRAVRYGPAFAERGINVNFVARNTDGSLSIATYERGVEAETLACGTGVTAAAIVAAKLEGAPSAIGAGARFSYEVQAKGGRLRVRGEAGAEGGYRKLYLEGPAVRVFGGSIAI